MSILTFPAQGIVIGKNALEHLKTIDFTSAVIVTGGSSMFRTGVIDKVQEYLSGNGKRITVYNGVGKNPTTYEVLKGLQTLNDEKPDVIIAIGGGSAIDCAKCMTLFYEFPMIGFNNVLTIELPKQRKTQFIAIPSTSGTGSEVTHVTVITNTEENQKFAIKANILKPDLAIIDGALAMTMPSNIAAETGMDALTHALECYINNNLDDFDAALAKDAIEGIVKYLPSSCEKVDEYSRRKVHNYQCMAGIAFSNVGLGMVHGIAMAVGGKYNYSHGCVVGIILPYVLEYNKRNSVVKEKLEYISRLCDCDDIVKKIQELKVRLGIPKSFKALGLDEKIFKKDFEVLLDRSLSGATLVNSVLMTKEEMEKILNAVYYGKEIDF